jgi:6-phosphofructo-2-kinase / fructose-2,6-biphosphatase 2
MYVLYVHYAHCTAAAESEYNMQGRIGGDASLTPAGQVYAAKLFEYMQQLYPTHQNSNGSNSSSNSSDSELVVWTSTMVRTGQTVSYMLGHYEIVKWKVRSVSACILSVCMHSRFHY